MNKIEADKNVKETVIIYGVLVAGLCITVILFNIGVI
jgi:hypothetical protein